MITIFEATVQPFSFIIKENWTSISKATKLSEEFYENTNWNDVKNFHEELVNSYKEKVNNDAI